VERRVAGTPKRHTYGRVEHKWWNDWCCLEWRSAQLVNFTDTRAKTMSLSRGGCFAEISADDYLLKLTPGGEDSDRTRSITDLDIVSFR